MRTACMIFLLCSAVLAQQANSDDAVQNHDPDKALITADDVTLFWHAYDVWMNDMKGDPARLADTLQKEYLDKGSQGVKDFTATRSGAQSTWLRPFCKTANTMRMCGTTMN